MLIYETTMPSRYVYPYFLKTFEGAFEYGKSLVRIWQIFGK